MEPLQKGPAKKAPRLGRWQRVLADALDQNLAVGVRAAVADHLGRAPTRAEVNAARRAAAAGARLIQADGLDSKTTSQPPLPMHSKSFTGSSGASIDASGAIKDTGNSRGSLADRHEMIGEAGIVGIFGQDLLEVLAGQGSFALGKVALASLDERQMTKGSRPRAGCECLPEGFTSGIEHSQLAEGDPSLNQQVRQQVIIIF
jgi:hypothetical protein